MPLVSHSSLASSIHTRIKYLLQNCMQMKQPKRPLLSNIRVLGIATILHYNNVHNPTYSMIVVKCDLSLPQCVCI